MEPLEFQVLVTKTPERERSRVIFMKERVLKIRIFLTSSGDWVRLCQSGRLRKHTWIAIEKHLWMACVHVWLQMKREKGAGSGRRRCVSDCLGE